MKLYKQNLKNINKIKPFQINVSVYGLGKMGLPLAAVFAKNRFNVIGVDTNLSVVNKINRGENPIPGERGLSYLIKKFVKNKKLYATTDGKLASEKTDIKIIIVPTFLNKNNQPDLSMVKNVTEKIGEGLKEGDIVILESTAPPKTTLEIIAKILEEKSGLKLNVDFSVAHCPERTNSGTAISDIEGRINPKIIGASDEETTNIITHIYKKINKRGVLQLNNPTVAEMVKISEMVYRDVKIAYANTLALICNELHIDVHEVIEAANTDAGCEILKPGPGVGGHCIPVYPYFIFDKVKNNFDLLKSARKINDSMSNFTINLIKKSLSEKNKKLKESTILILGIAYRGGVKETRMSPGIKIYKELEKKSINVFAFDPLFKKEEIEKLGMNYRDSFKNIDCVVITAEHDEFKNLNWKKISKEIRTKSIVDTKSIINVNKLKKMGFSINII